MKQPELGRKISELRKAKGLTQEELVEKSNISVRTIQRIETGEVTPRMYTIKTILAALESDFSMIKDDAITKDSVIDVFIKWIKKVILINISTDRPSDYLVKQLKIALLFGVSYFILSFFEVVAEYFKFEEAKTTLSTSIYVIIKIAILLSLFFFQRGFIVIGNLFNNYLLKTASIIFICCNILAIGYDIASLFYKSIEYDVVYAGFTFILGGTLIFYGVSLNILRKKIGRITIFSGVFEVIGGCLYMTIVLFPVGDILLIPAELFEIGIIYRIIEIIRSKQEESSLV